MTNWREKVILITGASSGIGEAAAMKFAESGAQLYLVGLEEELLQKVNKRCIATGLPSSKIHHRAGDLTKTDFRQIIVKDVISIFGKLDSLVDIAGNVVFTEIGDVTEEQYDQALSLNQKSHFFLAQLCIPLLKATNGNIIFMSSVRSHIPSPKVIMYCMAKAALDMLTKCLAKDLAQFNIRVNAVNPGFIDGTNILRSSLNVTDEEQSRYAQNSAADTALKRPGTPNEVASLVLFLTSDEASYITGTINNVDGGQSLFC